MALDISEIILSSFTYDLLEESDSILRNYDYNYTVTNGTNISTTNFTDTTNITTTINDGCNNGDFSYFLNFIDIASKVTTAVIVLSSIDLVYDILKCIYDFSMVVDRKIDRRYCCEMFCWTIGKEIIDFTLLTFVVFTSVAYTLRSCKDGEIDVDDQWDMVDDELINKNCQFESCPAQIDKAIDDLSEVSENLKSIAVLAGLAVIFGPLFPIISCCCQGCSNNDKVFASAI